jgi:hypothetical protein
MSARMASGPMVTMKERRMPGKEQEIQCRRKVAQEKLILHRKPDA